MTKVNYGRLTAGLVAAWFILSLSASALHLFNTNPDRPPLSLLIAAITPIALFVLWYRNSKPFREFALGLNPRALTLVQSWRVAGFVFLVLYTYRILPGAFALPAGWGDIAVGATAAFAALRLASPNHKAAFIFWQVLGMTDLVMAITLGGAGRYLSPQEFANAAGVTSAPMTVLPLSLIPTFAVPLFLMLHMICIAQAMRWPAAATTGTGDRRPLSAI